MIVFPTSKINIGLFITAKRDDGFHDLESLFYPVELCDALEVIPHKQGRGEVLMHYSGLPIPNTGSDNLVVRAYRILNERYSIPSVDVFLHKAIPMGAGLGGGSSDAAFMLRALKDLFDLPLSWDELLAYAAELGSDCPFFLQDKPCLVSGRGEVLKPVDFSLKGKFLVLINPGVHVATGKAFSLINPNTAPAGWKEFVLNGDVSAWQGHVWNDFQAPVIESFTGIAEVIEALQNAGAEYVSMTGSGSSCYGIFEHCPGIEKIKSKDWFIKLIWL